MRPAKVIKYKSNLVFEEFLRYHHQRNLISPALPDVRRRVFAPTGSGVPLFVVEPLMKHAGIEGVHNNLHHHEQHSTAEDPISRWHELCNTCHIIINAFIPVSCYATCTENNVGIGSISKALHLANSQTLFVLNPRSLRVVYTLRMKSAWGFLTLVATLVAGLGHNNWDKPCFDGECAYDIPDHTGQSGTIKLFASNPRAIADITPAAGWVVLDCDPHALVQDIRLVCKGDDSEGAGCNHLFNGGDPVDKYVRLPESCSQSSFGRINKFWVHDDQSVPEHHGVVRRDNVAPQVFAISIDDKFDQIDYTKHGDVRYVAYGVSAPGVDTNFAIPDDISDPNAAKRFLTKAVDDLQAGLRDKRLQMLQARFAATPAIDLPANLNKSESGKVTIGSSTTPLLPLKLESDPKTCESSGHGTNTTGSFSVSLHIDTYMWGSGKWGGAVSGLNGAIDAVLGFLEDFSVNMKHSYTVSVELSGEFEWNYDTPPVSIPEVTALHLGVVQLGLMGGAKVAVKVTAKAEAKVTSSVQYGLEHISLTIPAKKDVHLTPYFNSTPFDSSFSGEASATFGVNGGIIPKLMVGAATSTGTARADAWLGVEVGLGLAAQATQAFGSGSDGSTSTSPSSRPPSSHAAARPPSSHGARPPSSHGSRPPSSHGAKPRAVDIPDNADVELNYCAKLYVKVKVGVEASIQWDWLKSWLGWSPSVSGDIDLFTHDWVLSESGGFCGPQNRRSLEGAAASNSSLALVRRTTKAPAKPTSTKTPASCLPKTILGKAKSFLNHSFPLPLKK
ncbi:hypothetical protein AB1N83_005597 [Pleurotus pulmonarius]